MRCRALLCGVVLCRAVLCCTVLSVALYLLFRTCQVSFDEVSSSSTELQHNVIFFLITSNAPSSAQLSYSSAAPSAAPCGAVRCMPCPAVLRRTALCFLLNIQQYQVSCEIPGTRYRYVRVYSSTPFLHCPSSFSVLFASPSPKITPVLPIRIVTSPTSIQHSTGQSILHK